jgi:ubiquinone/menaquinone biosynthesis C-methylase UbiE
VTAGRGAGEDDESLDDGSLDEELLADELLEDLDDDDPAPLRAPMPGLPIAADRAPPDEDTTAHRAVPERPRADDIPTGRLNERSIHREPPRATRRRLESGTTPNDAALFDSVVVPQWSTLFGAALVERVPRGFRGQILDVAAGTGYPTFAILDRLDQAGRIVAIDRDPALLDLLRRRTIAVSGRRVFARTESLEALSFGDEVFDVIVGCALASPTLMQARTLAELHRVTVVGGRLLASCPLRGTFEEVLDMFREVAERRSDAALEARVETLASRAPTSAELVASLESAGFERVSVTESERQLVFRTARDVFTNAVLRHVALAEWRAAAGFERGAEDVLVEVEHALATYLPRGPIALSVRVGVVDGVRR